MDGHFFNVQPERDDSRCGSKGDFSIEIKLERNRSCDLITRYQILDRLK